MSHSSCSFGFACCLWSSFEQQQVMGRGVVGTGCKESGLAGAHTPPACSHTTAPVRGPGGDPTPLSSPESVGQWGTFPILLDATDGEAGP